MTEDRSARGGSSISRPRRSRGSSRSVAASSASGFPGSDSPRARAEAHGITPSRDLGQHFLVDANLAAAIAADAEIGDANVVEIGAGLGSLSVALADAGAARVIAIEFDRALLPALREAVADRPAVEVLAADATKLGWSAVLGDERWIAVGNLPYNVATDIVLDVVERAAMVERLVVMVQREVAERFTARPRRPGYGPTTLRIAYRTVAEIARRVPPEVFWPRPTVASAVVRLSRRGEPAVAVDEASLWRVVDEAFSQRRKTMRAALRRLGASDPETVLAAAGIPSDARPDTLPLDAFARVAGMLAR